MPKIRWNNLPPTPREHPFDQVAERQISAEDLYKPKLWRESEPEAADGPWYKRFWIVQDLWRRSVPQDIPLERTGGKREATVDEISQAATNSWRWLVSDATRRICSHFAPATPRNRTKRDEERRTIGQRGTVRPKTLFPQDQRVTGHGRVVLITQRSLVQIQPPQPRNTKG